MWDDWLQAIHSNKPVTRIEIIGPDGREYVRYLEESEWSHYSLQDEGQTLKVFIEQTK